MTPAAGLGNQAKRGRKEEGKKERQGGSILDGPEYPEGVLMDSEGLRCGTYQGVNVST